MNGKLACRANDVVPRVASERIHGSRVGDFSKVISSMPVRRTGRQLSIYLYLYRRHRDATGQTVEKRNWLATTCFCKTIYIDDPGVEKL